MKQLKIMFCTMLITGILFSPVHAVMAKDSGYSTQLSTVQELGSLTNGNKKVFKDVQPNKESISLLKDNKEITYDTGLVTPTRGIVTYSDLKKAGYETFTAYIGVSKESRSSNATVKFQVYGDKKLLFESKEMTGSSEQETISVNIKDIDVLQLVTITTNGSQKVVTAWADPKLNKSEATPSLEVSDLEFPNPRQVTKDNILEYAKATSFDGKTDLTTDITYTTNYIEGTAGNYNITYSVTDPTTKATRTRTVALIVRSTEVYKVNLSKEELTTPFASYLYHGRNSSSYQYQKAWDVAVKELLSYDNSDNHWESSSRWGEMIVPITFHFYDMGIFLTPEDVNYFTTQLMDDEPRMFLLKDWGATCTYKDGIVDTVTVYVGNGMKDSDSYQKMLQKIESNVTMLYDAVKEDMSEAQMLKAVASKYAGWLKYGDNGQLLSNSLGNGVAVCGGNARGYIYLGQRMGIKSYWVRTSSHAWAHSRLDGKWYRTDLLANMYLKAETNGIPYHKEAWTQRHRNWVALSPVDYPQRWMNYPTLTLDIKDDFIILPGDEFSVQSLVTSVSSIYDDDIASKVTLETDLTNKYGKFDAVVSVTDSRGNKVSKTSSITIVNGTSVFLPVKQAIKNTGFSDHESVSLYKNGKETFYEKGYRSNETRELVFDISDKNYTYFESYVGIEKHVRDNTAYGFYGKVQFEVYIDNELAYRSDVIGWKDNQEYILVKIPEGAKQIRLVNVPKGSGNNHGGWGNPRFIEEQLDEITPTSTDVDNDTITPLLLY